MTRQRQLSNTDIVVYALALLGGAERRTYSEDVAVRCYELAPSRFSWTRPAYRKRGWPDKYIVKTALEDAKKPKCGSLVDGSYALELARDGWTLTPAGVKWVQANEARLRSALQQAQPALRMQDAERFLKRMRDQALYAKFKAGRELDDGDRYAFTDMLSCAPDASPQLVSSKFTRLRTVAAAVGEASIEEFLDACSRTFPELTAPTRDRTSGAPQESQ